MKYSHTLQAVLSVISAQIKIIQNALSMNLKRFHFEGSEIALDKKTVVMEGKRDNNTTSFLHSPLTNTDVGRVHHNEPYASVLGRYDGPHITPFLLHPTAGYAGRTELPDNLKALFRPVVMVVPDLELICENSRILCWVSHFFPSTYNASHNSALFRRIYDVSSDGGCVSYNFHEHHCYIHYSAKNLAKKMVELYRLAKGQLSKQHHYDFGLRALKSVLVMAGQLKRGSPDLSEDMVLMRALRDMNLRMGWWWFN